MIACNLVLLAAGWTMAVYAYPRLPHKIPLWLPFAGQPVIQAQKSWLFFLYPAAQTLFFVFFAAAGLRHVKKRINASIPLKLTAKIKTAAANLEREHLFLSLIFFNLVFIHIHRSLILLAHNIESGVSLVYFGSLFAIILLLIPLFNLKKRMLISGRNRESL